MSWETTAKRYADALRRWMGVVTFEIASRHWATEHVQAFRSVVQWLRHELEHQQLPIPIRMTNHGMDTVAARNAYPAASVELAERLASRAMSRALSDTERREAARCLKIWQEVLERHGLPAV